MLDTCIHTNKIEALVDIRSGISNSNPSEDSSSIQELMKQVEVLKKTIATKDRFIQIIAHDLRRPFNVLLGVSNLLKTRLHLYGKDKVEDLLDLNHQSIEKTFSLLEDLLTWSNSQTDSLPFKPEVLSLQSILYQSVDCFRIDADSKFINIRLNYQKNIAVVVDEFMLRAILRNLLSNAIKFTNKGGEITITAEKTNTHILISISDNGVGIDERALMAIWDSSNTYSTSGTSNEQGTGLGLTICKDFVERHKGRIWVDSELGVGSTFWFTLPLPANFIGLSLS